MRWTAEERLRRALPYGKWQWSDENSVLTETLFNRRYQPIATRVSVQLVTKLLEPPRPLWRASEYYYGLGTNSPQNGYPWRDKRAREAARDVLRAWGIDPAEAERRAAAEIKEERRATRLGRRWR